MRVIIDTNVLLSSFISTSYPRRVIDLWKADKFKLCLSSAILDEYLLVLNNFGFDEVRTQEINELLTLFSHSPNTIFTNSTPQLKIVDSDPDDDKFFECAVALKAAYIISGDKAVLAVGKYFNIEVVSPKTFVERMASG